VLVAKRTAQVHRPLLWRERKDKLERAKEMSPVLALLIAALGAMPMAPAGHRIDIGGATLILPEGYKPERGVVNLVVHLHGAEAAVEQALDESGWRVAAIVFNRKGLSSVYAGPFADPKLFPALLDRALASIRAEGLADEPKLGRVAVSSFSAGFGGVRELLNVPEHFRRIDALILADSLYCGYAGAETDRRLDPEKMAGFRRFAAEAAAGRKILVLTHSAQVPDGYASTTETADDLIRHIGASAELRDDDWRDGWRLTRRCQQGKFLVLGFSGSAPEDHMRHLRRLGAIWKAAPNPFDDALGDKGR
jgi:hypothetical protein